MNEKKFEAKYGESDNLLCNVLVCK